MLAKNFCAGAARLVADRSSSGSGRGFAGWPNIRSSGAVEAPNALRQITPPCCTVLELKRSVGCAFIAHRWRDGETGWCDGETGWCAMNAHPTACSRLLFRKQRPAMIGNAFCFAQVNDTFWNRIVANFTDGAQTSERCNTKTVRMNYPTCW